MATYMTNELSLQEKYAPTGICFGCGVQNERGLHIKSYPAENGSEDIIAEFHPEPYQQAFPGVVNGGIIGALLDCHSNWTAAYYLMKKTGAAKDAEAPCTVTADYAIKLLRPTPSDAVLHLKARVVESPSETQAIVEAELIANDKVCATCRGTFVAVGPGHPAYHRW
jgi:acyl-coenzyme A thioesterase PaaI-like protein